MERSLAIVLYRCEVAGSPTESLDIQVRYFEGLPRERVEAVLSSEPVTSYTNGEGQLVCWPFVRVLAVEPFEQSVNGAEVVGFVTGCHEFAAWSRHGT
jgi:hypothetical protein